MKTEARIEEIFGPDGFISGIIESYEHRPQQTAMAKAVFRALTKSETLIVEAPTGTGKTLAYIVAAALSRKRTAISTGTKNLQEQLFFKDIPFVTGRIFPRLKAALLKGRGNFICHHKVERILKAPFLEGFGAGKSLQMILDWYRDTGNGGKGDRVELKDLSDDDPSWFEVNSSVETCLGRKCPHRETCFVQRMKSEAVDADLMIVNHYLLASDLSLREAGYGEAIPRFEALVVDEAHGFEDALTQHLGFHLSRFRISRLIRDAGTAAREAGLKVERLHDAFKNVEDSAKRLFEEIEARVKLRTRFRKTHPHVLELSNACRTALHSLSKLLKANLVRDSDDLRLAAQRADEIAMELELILGGQGSEEYSCWAETRDGAIFLNAAPVEVAARLHDWLYEKVPSVVYTSATLSTGNGFQYFKSRVGLEATPKLQELILDTPFDYASQTVLFVPTNLPEPSSPTFNQEATPIIDAALEITSGRAFVLFTAYRNMQEVHEALVRKLPYPVLMQGQKPRTQLLDEFRSNVGSVLFATASFWEGVDVQGEALSCVIIDRLPFAPPDEPVVSARIERIRTEGGNPFNSFQVPMAALTLKQGLGRLIRTRSDRGLLCILDNRLFTKSYGKSFLAGLKGIPIVRKLSEAEAFFSAPDEDASDENVEAAKKSRGRFTAA
jgi:ATP-dependent DNA helicase DinG